MGICYIFDGLRIEERSCDSAVILYLWGRGEKE